MKNFFLLIFAMASCSNDAPSTNSLETLDVSLPTEKTDQILAEPEKKVFFEEEGLQNFYEKCKTISYLSNKSEESLVKVLLALGSGVKGDCEEATNFWGKNKIMNLSNQGLVDIEDLKFFPHVTEIDLSQNFIENMSPLLTMTDLEKINLKDNQLSSIPSLSSLKKLKVLSLRKNKIVDLKNSLQALETLTFLSLGKNLLTSPPLLWEPSALEFLDLSENKLQKTPFEKAPLSLKSLTLNSNALTSWSPGLMDFNGPFLTLLDLRQNSSLPPPPFSTTSIQHFYASHEQDFSMGTKACLQDGGSLIQSMYPLSDCSFFPWVAN